MPTENSRSIEGSARVRYRGGVARDYESARRATPQWRREQLSVAHFLASLPPASLVLDLPVGTGRWAASGRGLRLVGVDISPDMLELARRTQSGGYQLVRASALELPLLPKSVDHTVSIRFSNWLSLESFDRLLGELARITRKSILLEVHESRPLSRLEVIPNLGVDFIRSPIHSVRRSLKWIRRQTSDKREPRDAAPKKYHHHDVAAVHQLFARHCLRVQATDVVQRSTLIRPPHVRQITLYHLEPG